MLTEGESRGMDATGLCQCLLPSEQKKTSTLNLDKAAIVLIALHRLKA